MNCADVNSIGCETGNIFGPKMCNFEVHLIQNLSPLAHDIDLAVYNIQCIKISIVVRMWR